MSIRRVVLMAPFAVFLGLSACGKKDMKKETENLSYQYDVNGCSTDTQSFKSRAEYCEGLQDEVRNKGCAQETRKAEYTKTCGADFKAKGTATPTTAAVPAPGEQETSNETTAQPVEMPESQTTETSPTSTAVTPRPKLELDLSDLEDGDQAATTTTAVKPKAAGTAPVSGLPLVESKTLKIDEELESSIVGIPEGADLADAVQTNFKLACVTDLAAVRSRQTQMNLLPGSTAVLFRMKDRKAEEKPILALNCEGTRTNETTKLPTLNARIRVADLKQGEDTVLNSQGAKTFITCRKDKLTAALEEDQGLILLPGSYVTFWRDTDGDTTSEPIIVVSCSAASK